MPNLSKTFFKNLEAYQRGEPLIINQGGQGSSKTYSILQLLYLAARRSKTGLRIWVVSYALPHLKSGAMADFDRILTSFGEIPALMKNISTSTYYIGNSTVVFFGVEGNIAMAHGTRRDILYINECNRKITYEVYDQLASRTQGTVFVDFNPDQEFWLYTKVIPNFKHTIIKSTYLDNPWLPETERFNIEQKRDKEGFANWWKVYGLGELGKLEGCIFPNWVYGEWPTGKAYGHGLDFGFNAPDALVRMVVDEKALKVYWDERIYKSGNSSEQLKELVGYHCKRHELIIADSADARMIKELSKNFNIKPTNKAKAGWSVPEAIKIMQGYEFVVTEDSANLAKEFNQYIWSDKKAGIPIDAFNHLIDAGRYYFQYTQTGGGGAQQWHG
jgi:phage terminase large subunit